MREPARGTAARPFVLFLLVCTYSWAIVAPVDTDSLNTLTGSRHTRIAWIEGGAKLYGGGRLVGYDSKSNTVTEILPAATRQNKPIICSGGHKVLVTIDYEVYVVNWDGTGKRRLVQGICSDAWIHPATGQEWIVVRSGGDSTGGRVTRYRLADPTDSLLLWNESPSGDHYMNWWQISADGTLAVDFLPWYRAFAVLQGGLQTNGERIGLSRGCWSSLAPDNSYYWFNFPSSGPAGHSSLSIFRRLDAVEEHVLLDAGPLPEGSRNEFYHPKFASKGARFLVLTAGYLEGSTESDSAEVYFGKFASDYTSFDGWVRLTHNALPDYTPEAWVGVEPTAPSILLSPGELEIKVAEGAPSPAPSRIVVSSLYGRLTSLTATTDSPWLTASVHPGTTVDTIVNTVDTSGLRSGSYTATATVEADNAVPTSRTYPVSLIVTGTPVPTAVSLDRSHATVNAGDRVHFTATVYDQEEKPLEPQPILDWRVEGETNDVDSTGAFVAGDSTGTFVVRVSLDSLKDSATVAVIPADQQAITLKSPTGERNYMAGSYVMVQWEAAEAVRWAKIQLSVDGGLQWYDIGPDKINKWGGFSKRITIPIYLTDTANNQISTLTDQGMLRVCEYLDEETFDATDTTFSITDPLVLTVPKGDTTYFVGDTMGIWWGASQSVNGVVLQVSADGGKSWHNILREARSRTDPGWGVYKWKTPATVTADDSTAISLLSDSCLIKVYDYTDENIEATTESLFTIARPPVEVFAPTDSSHFWVAETLTVRWRVDTSRVKTCAVRFSSDGGATWVDLADSIAVASPDTQEFSWVIADSIDSVSAISQECKVRVIDIKDGWGRSNEGTFAVHGFPIEATKPDSADVIAVGDMLQIAAAVDTARVDTVVAALSIDSGNTWTNIGTSYVPDTAGTIELSWTVRDSVLGRSTVSEACRIRVRSVADTSIAAMTNGFFSIQPNPISVTNPIEDQRYTVGDTLYIRWTADQNRVQSCGIALSVDSGLAWIGITDTGIDHDAKDWGNYAWVLPDSLQSISLVSSACRIRVHSTTGQEAAQSRGYFTIEPALGPRRPPVTEEGCGCGTGTGLAFIPPLGFRLNRMIRRRRKKHKSRTAAT